MTSENVSESETAEPMKAASVKAVDDQLIDELVGRAQAEGLHLTGEGGLLQQLTKRLLESALEGEITDHLGYDKHDPASKDGGNSRNGKRSKTVLTDVGPVEITVPRDRDGSFEPKIVKKREKRLTGVDEMVISLAAKSLTTGEVQAHLDADRRALHQPARRRDGGLRRRTRPGDPPRFPTGTGLVAGRAPHQERDRLLPRAGENLDLRRLTRPRRSSDHDDRHFQQQCLLPAISPVGRGSQPHRGHLRDHG